MKKAILLSLLAVFLVLLCSCYSATGSPSSQSVTNNGAMNHPQASETTPEPNGNSFNENEQEILRVMAAGKRFVTAIQSGTEPPDKSERQSGDADGMAEWLVAGMPPNEAVRASARDTYVRGKESPERKTWRNYEK